jgi:hypothetical protein
MIAAAISIKSSSGMKGCAELRLNAPRACCVFDFFGG